MGTKVRDIVGTGEPFKGSLSRAVGQHTGAAEFEVIRSDGSSKFVCMGHLIFQVRESIVQTGIGVMVLDARSGAECQYERLA
jgi:hypothetical protein